MLHMVPRSADHRLILAGKCARLAALAYRREEIVENSLDENLSVHCFERAGVSGFVCWDSQVIVVSIAGTNEVWDWWRNMAATPAVHGPPHWRITGHSGFIGDAEHVAAVCREIKVPFDSDRIAYLVGHSLGGATAVHLPIALNLVAGKTKVITFGAPRSIKQSSVLDYDYDGRLDVTQYARVEDIVPMIPFQSSLLPFGGFCHPGQVWWIRPDCATATIIGPSPFWSVTRKLAKYAGAYLGRLIYRGPRKSAAQVKQAILAAHDIKSYTDCLDYLTAQHYG